MNEKNAQTNITSDVAPLGLNRREAVKRGALLGGAVGAAWTAPMVYDSFSTQAAAAGTSLFDNGTPDTYTGITIPVGRSATFVVTGGGGGGGSFQGLNGGSGTKRPRGLILVAGVHRHQWSRWSISFGTMMNKTARQNWPSRCPARRSVDRLSCPKLESQEFVRSTGQRSPMV